jgi:NTP pyrophosphatase (non-canonical NTP hydrolase)
MNENQEKVKRFSEDNKLGMSIEHSFIDVSSELGELAKEILKMRLSDTKDIDSQRKIILEFGDVFYSLINLANQMGIDLDRALNFALEKYEDRIREKGSPGSS